MSFYSPSPGADWERIDYNFYIEGHLDDKTWNIPEGSIQQIEYPSTVTISGGIHPTITWSKVANADWYRVRLFPIDNGNPKRADLLDQSGNITDDGSLTYSYQYTGGAFENYGTLAVTIETYDNAGLSSSWVNRSVHYSQHNPASGGFDYESYLDANADLPPSWGKAECMNHYIHYGFWENRAVSFNLDEYLNANPDLPRNWTYEEALNQYNLYGKNENRLLAFDTQEYLSLYSDLPQDWVYDQAYNHFMNYGRQEGRVASFDETAYLEMYSDLPQSWEQAEAFYHYFYYGINEGRVYDPYDEQVFTN